MTYKIEVPIPNYVHDTPRSLSGFIELVQKYRQHIDCLYFPLGHVDVGIDVWGIRAPSYVYLDDGSVNRKAVIAWESALDEILRHVDLPVKILLNNTFNPAFHDQDKLRIIAKKLAYYANKFTVSSVTIADVLTIPFVQSIGMKVCLSTNSHNSFAELDMILAIYGMDVLESLVVQRDLNRNPTKLLKYLKDRGLTDKAVLMVNEGCVNGCPYKAPGDVEISISDVHTKSNHIHTTGCTILGSDPLAWTFLTSPFLTKQMLDQVYPSIQTVKLAGRNLPVSNLKKQLDHWVNGTEHKLKDVLNVFGHSDITTHDLSNEYVRDVTTCNKECYNCKKCEHQYASLNHRHQSIYWMLKQTQELGNDLQRTIS